MEINEPSCSNKTGKIYYAWSLEYMKYCNFFEKEKGRAVAVHSLINAYGLFKNLRIFKPRKASKTELSDFHSKDYVQYVEASSSKDCDPEALEAEGSDYGFGTSNDHVGRRSRAAGFCYVNDCVLGILKLREKFSRVLYVDIDIHHGDGTGDTKDIGCGKGKYYSVNVPLKEGLSDVQLIETFDRTFPSVMERFLPEAVVVQCGADGLSCDPVGVFNLTSVSFCHIVKNVLSWELPTLILGGGGYRSANVAKCWSKVTATILGLEIEDDIPEHSLFSLYSPDYSLSISTGKRLNQNCKAFIETTLADVVGNIERIPRYQEL